MRILPPALILVVAASPASAHRLDEFLQAAIVSVGKAQLQVQMTLTPGVAVLPFVIAKIDTDGDGGISREEQRAYADHFLHDLVLEMDGNRLTPQFVSVKFPGMVEMKEGNGAIQLEFKADLPRGLGQRKLTFENHHQSRIAAYQVNSLVPRDPDIRIESQVRNYSQSNYRLEYFQSGVRSDAFAWPPWAPGVGGMSALLLLLILRLRFQRRASGNRACA